MKEIREFGTGGQAKSAMYSWQTHLYKDQPLSRDCEFQPRDTLTSHFLASCQYFCDKTHIQEAMWASSLAQSRERKRNWKGTRAVIAWRGNLGDIMTPSPYHSALESHILSDFMSPWDRHESPEQPPLAQLKDTKGEGPKTHPGTERAGRASSP